LLINDEHLLEEHKKMKGDPDEVRILGQLYEILLTTPSTSPKNIDGITDEGSVAHWIGSFGGLFLGQRGRME
jgi:hypothetical protein